MKNEKAHRLLALFTAFLKIGAFTFGGGYAMIPLIQKEAVEKRSWISADELLEIVAVAESTPGPIAINAATFVGYKTAGFPGAFLATLGVVLPSFLIIAAISFVLEEFSSVKAVKYAFIGIRAGVLALILKALVSMFQSSRKDLFSCILMAVVFVLTAFLKINVLYVLLGSAAAGLIYSLIAGRKKNDLS